MESEGDPGTDEDAISIVPLRDDALRTFSQHTGILVTNPTVLPN